MTVLFQIMNLFHSLNYVPFRFLEIPLPPTLFYNLIHYFRLFFQSCRLVSSTLGKDNTLFRIIILQSNCFCRFNPVSYGKEKGKTLASNSKNNFKRIAYLKTHPSYPLFYPTSSNEYSAASQHPVYVYN